MSDEYNTSHDQQDLYKLRRMTLIEGGVIALLVCMMIGMSIAMIVRKPETVPVSLETTEPVQTQPTEATTEKRDSIFIIQDGVDGEIYLPVIPNVPLCELDQENIITRNGLLYYVEDQEVTSKLGIDISSHQGVIDWETVHAAGVDFALIRAAYRGYGSGELMEDERFHENVQGALAAGVDVGVYCFSQAVTIEEAREEAELTLSMLKDYEITYPVVFDWEFVSANEARTGNISVKALTDCTVAFCEAVQEAGYIPMVYQNKHTSLFKLDLSRVAEFDFWLAEYNETPGYHYNYDIWQYTDRGTLPGITGEVDLNICFKDYTSEE